MENQDVKGRQSGGFSKLLLSGRGVTFSKVNRLFTARPHGAQEAGRGGGDAGDTGTRGTRPAPADVLLNSAPPGLTTCELLQPSRRATQRRTVKCERKRKRKRRRKRSPPLLSPGLIYSSVFTPPDISPVYHQEKQSREGKKTNIMKDLCLARGNYLLCDKLCACNEEDEEGVVVEEDEEDEEEEEEGGEAPLNEADTRNQGSIGRNPLGAIAGHQGAIQMFGFHFPGALTCRPSSFTVIYRSYESHISQTVTAASHRGKTVKTAQSEQKGSRDSRSPRGAAAL
ncbi:unnamed protein product [Pleuronectes platessa]|uniref:Uncharacterized protein n=1 Tax=Pleuronectes platessa TaxID=8262 RepID=A0A9N7UNA5_PLEPL|nr:unnamed protein product [Pleuronectes platessa]